MKRFNFLARATIVVLMISTTMVLPGKAIVTQSWISGMPGPEHRLDEPCGIASDARGNIYIAGKCWTHNTNFITLKYDPEGAISWYSIFGSQSNAGDIPVAMVADQAGNVYITGTSYISGHSDDVVTVKYNALGQLLWSVYYNSPNNLSDRPTALVLDEEGNTYVTGYTGLDFSDYLTIKYNTNGVQQWAATYNGPGNGYDQAYDIAVDGQGNVYVAGMSGYLGSDDCAVIKYNSAGVQQWIAWHHDSNEEFWYCYLALDAEANVYVVGASIYNNQTDYLTIKFNTLGQEEWFRSYDGPQHQMDDPCGIEVDSEDNIIVSGTSVTPLSWGNQYVTIKYDSDGNQLWLRGYRGDWVESNTMNSDLILDTEGSVYLTGCSAYYSVYPNCGTIKYDPQGCLKWIAISEINHFGGGGSYLALDPEENLLVSGFYSTIGMDPDFMTVKLHQIQGDVQTTMIPDITPVVIPAQGGSFSYELLSINGVIDSLAVDYWWKAIYPTSQNVQPVSGPIQSILPMDSTLIQRHQRVPGNAPAGTYRYILNAGEYPGIIWATDTIQVTKLATGNGPPVEDWENTDGLNELAISDFHPSPFILHTSHPNPFNASTVARFELRAASQVSLKVYDTTGRLVATLVDGWRAAGTHEVRFDGSKLSSGIYVAKLDLSGSGATPTTNVGKLVLVK